MMARFGLDRLGLSGRLAAIVLLAILAALTLGAGLLFTAQEGSKPGQSSLPGKVANIVALIENATIAQRPLILRAINSSEFSLVIAAQRPQQGPSMKPLPAVEWMVSQYFDDPSPRQITAFLTDETPGRPFSRLLSLVSPFSNAPLTIAARLGSGEYAVFTTRGSPASRIFGLPPGFWIGALGAILALIAVRAVMREAKPLKQLEASLAGFAEDAAPRAVAPAGAPDLKRLIEATNEMQDRIAALISGRTILMASISHDLRSYLTRLRLRVEMLADDHERSKAVDDIDTMTTMLEDALAVARSQVALERRETVDLGALAAAEASGRVGENIELELSADHNDAIIEGDPIALRRLIANLLDNAERYGTRVKLGIETSQGDVRLTVEDDGPGIPTSQRAQLFDPFHVLDPARSRATGGSGLGLAIVKQIADAHGATVTIDSSPPGGARFTVIFTRDDTGNDQPAGAQTMGRSDSLMQQP